MSAEPAGRLPPGTARLPERPYRASVLLRDVRLVPVGARGAADGAGAAGAPVDVRIRDGTVAEVAPGLARDPGEEVIQAAGRYAIPGLWDAHVHLEQWAATLTRLDLAGTADPGEVVARVAAHVATLPPDAAADTVTGYGYRWAAWPRRPTVAELDAVSGAHPVVLVSGDAHNAWLSSRALALLGLPPRAGAIEERDWFDLLPRLGELPGRPEQADAAYRRAVGEAAGRGVVGVVDLEFGDGVGAWPARLASGVHQLRVRVATYPDGLDRVVKARLRTGSPLPGGAGLLTMGPLKIISDGSLNTRTACCRRPYADAKPDPDQDAAPGAYGRMNYLPGELAQLLRTARAGGLEAAVHAVGDAAVGAALDAFAVTGAAGTIEHTQLVGEQDVRQMARLGIRASVQPAHLLDDRRVIERCWPDRQEDCFALRSLLRAGVVLALGSDAPVAPLDPWLAIAAAVHRAPPADLPWTPQESISAGDALAASTDRQGTLAPGSRGDVALLDDDPLPRPRETSGEYAARVRGMRVAATFVAGRPTHLAL